MASTAQQSQRGRFPLTKRGSLRSFRRALAETLCLGAFAIACVRATFICAVVAASDGFTMTANEAMITSRRGCRDAMFCVEILPQLLRVALVRASFDWVLENRRHWRSERTAYELFMLRPVDDSGKVSPFLAPLPLFPFLTPHQHVFNKLLLSASSLSCLRP